MDYEKALERARSAYGTGAYDDATLEFLFPQLKESEDERIRKAIIGLIEELQRSEKNFAGVELTDMLAYLEKQNHDGKKWITPAELNRLLTLRYESGFNDGVRGEMKKQEDHFRDDTKMVEQKPAEWSDEDRTTIERIVETIQDYAMETGQIDEVTCGTKEPLITYIRFLRSLRPQPHWKPSKKQISALEYFIRSWGESGTMSPQNPTLCAAKSLYNDLQKLL